MPPDAAKRCLCGAMLHGMPETGHALTCPKDNNVPQLRHVHWICYNSPMGAQDDLVLIDVGAATANALCINSKREESTTCGSIWNFDVWSLCSFAAAESTACQSSAHGTLTKRGTACAAGCACVCAHALVLHEVLERDN